jgi:hypothetical protein
MLLLRQSLESHVPDFHEIFLAQAALAKHLDGRLARDETIALDVPCAEDLVVVLLFLPRERPGYFGSLDLWVLEEGLECLLEGLLLLSGVELGCAGSSERLSRVSMATESCGAEARRIVVNDLPG